MAESSSPSGSIGASIQQFIRCLTKTKHRSHHLDPTDTDALHQRLKRKAYETLFKHLNGPLSKKYTLDNEEQKVADRSKDRLLQAVFQLRRNRKFDDGQRLEQLIDRLPDLEDAQQSDLKAVFEVLLRFAGSQSSQDPSQGVDIPLTRSKHKTVALPNGPLYHGDSKYLYQQEDGFKRYVHFSRELFEGLDSYYSSQFDGRDEFGSVQPYAVNYQVLNAEPGKGAHGSGLFGDMPILGNTHEKDNRVTLFHALTNSKTSRIDIKLTVPALPDTTNPDLLGLKVPVRNEMSEDEGFHENSSTSSVAETPTNSADAFWEAVLNYKPNKHFTWETIGRHPRTTERPYLTEAGPEALDALYKVLCHQASMLGKIPLRPQIIALEQKVLVRDALHALIAVPSVSFQLDQGNQCLTVNRDVCLRGVSPQSFHHLLQDFAVIGTDYLHLSKFSKQRTMGSKYSGGLVLQAFTTGVRRFLQYYQALVQLVPVESKKLTLLSVKEMFSELTSQLRYLADLCMCSQRGGGGTQPGDLADPFPTGINLLSYLYQEALDCRNLQKYRLVLSLLRISCGPYLMHVQDWIFHGVCHDIYGEFMISINDTYLHHRDKHYWTDGYVLTTPTVEDNVPIFLQDMAYDIYVCGKSINLLKLCSPEHFVCNPDVDVPRVSLTYSPEELQRTVDRSRDYLRHMRLLAKMKTISRAEKERQVEEAKHTLLAEARRGAARELKRIEDIIKGEREKVDKKKREIFKELKEQMQKDLVRRALAVEEELQEDKDRIEEIQRKEQAEADTESKLEREAREEIIEYYAKLSEEAAQREQRALWRIRRHRLDQRRIEWLTQEEESLRQAMNLRSRTGILPSGGKQVERATEMDDDNRAAIEEQQNRVESSAQTDFVPESDDIVFQVATDAKSIDNADVDTMESRITVSKIKVQRHAADSHFTVGQEMVASDEETGAQSQNVHGHPSESHFTVGQELEDNQIKERNAHRRAADSNPTVSEAQTGAEYQNPDSFGAQRRNQSPAVGVLISLGDSRVETGDLSNEDIESTLNLIQGDTTKIATQTLPLVERTAAPLNLLDHSISDFLPKEGNEDTGADEEKALIDPEADVEDVLLEIGSELPLKSQTDYDNDAKSVVADIVDELLGLTTTAESSTKDGAGKRKTWVKPDGIPSAPGHPSDSQVSLGHLAAGEQVKPKINIQGHAADSHFTVGQEMGALDEETGAQSQNVHGHPSESQFTVGQEAEDNQIKEKNVHGHSADSNFVVGQEIGGKVEAAQPSKSAHGHAADSNFMVGQEMVDKIESAHPSKGIHGHNSDSNFTVGQEMGNDGVLKQPDQNIHGHASDSNFVVGQDMAEGAVLEAPKFSTHGHATDSHFTTGLDVASGPALNKASIHGHSSDSTAGQLLYESDDKDNGVNLKPVNIHGHASDSSAGGVLYPIPEGDGSDPSVPNQAHTAVDGRSLHGHSSDSTIQGMMYNQPGEGPLPPGVRSNQVGHPSDSTAQKLLYNRAVLGSQAAGYSQISAQSEQHTEAEPVIWAGEGIEPLPDVFDMFGASPRTDLLAAIGFVPLSVEIGDYGVQASDNETLEADEKMSLPIIMKRSVTTPLLAQIGLVNQSILDYYLVELGIDKHFKALRSFLFLEDGEFGQSLCDQLFDKLAQGLRPAELLSPIVLNQVLPRAIQSSSNRESEYAHMLGFSLKWLPPFFKPNAIDTFDCLELRYRVDWPFNIVITETCLIKYNKVFSFLLQLKRTSWVLRDIYFQLKRSANVNHAGNSPQFRQLQLFRHEMQHFVSVMQGYVVNQVIHVSWEEFQRELKTNVHNLDDLHQKHADYLNKAVFRCLLNKKASVLMKIITDILCLILKVRTQLISSSWIYDQASHAVVHPAFQTIRSSYLAFKDYSGFLYKVVAKLVTRGYQPHLEEFLLRLNFNDFYEES